MFPLTNKWPEVEKDFLVPKQFQQSYIKGRHLALIEDQFWAERRGWYVNNNAERTTGFRPGG